MRSGVERGAERNTHERDTQSCGELFSVLCRFPKIKFIFFHFLILDNTVLAYRIVKGLERDVWIRTLVRNTGSYIIYIRSVKLFLTSYINNTQQTAYFQPPSSRCIDNLAFSELNLFHVYQMFQVYTQIFSDPVPDGFLKAILPRFKLFRSTQEKLFNDVTTVPDTQE